MIKFYSQNNPKSCVGYSDAEWARGVNDWKSTTGCLSKSVEPQWAGEVKSRPVLLYPQLKQSIIVGLTSAATWIRQLTKDLQSGPTRSRVANQSAICMAKNPHFHGRTKHIEIKYHFIWEKVLDEIIEVKYCPTNDRHAKKNTINHDKLARLHDLAGVKEMKDQSACKWQGVLESDTFVRLQSFPTCCFLYQQTLPTSL